MNFPRMPRSRRAASTDGPAVIGSYCPGSSARVRVQIQKPVSQVLLHLGKRQALDEPIQEEMVGRHLNMVSKMVPRKELEANPEALTETEQEKLVEVYEATFKLVDHEDFYEVEAVD